MIRNKQNIGAMQKGGALLKEKSEPVYKSVGLNRIVAGGEIYKGVVDVLDKIKEKLVERKKIEEEKNRLEADKILDIYRTSLSNAKTPEEFDVITKEIDGGVRSYFNSNEMGKEFWNKHGDELLENNKIDIENIRAQKENDFGRDSLNLMLANNQNLLVNADMKKGDILLGRGVNEINKTNFLSEDEKKRYREEYLKTGIYNLALNDVEGAKEEAKKYLIDDEEFLKGIDKIGELKKGELENKLLREKRNGFLGNLGKAMDLWYEKEKGNIDEAEFFALTREYGDLIIDNNKEGVVNVYNLVRKMNGGNELNEDELKSASNGLINAYRNNVIGLDEVQSISNKLLEAQKNKNVLNKLFDSQLDSFIDSVLVGDCLGKEKVAKSFMEEKARLGIEIYDTYYSKKLANYQSFINQGGTLTPQVERVLKKRAIDETKEEFGYKENKDGVISFGQLKSVLNKYYTGNDVNEVWSKFYKFAPYSDDKKEVMKKIALEQQKLEMQYPIFDNIKDVLEADLDVGDKFYFKGRLAIKKV